MQICLGKWFVVEGMTLKKNSDVSFSEIHLNLNSDLYFVPEALQVNRTSLTHEEIHVDYINNESEERARERFNDTSQSLLLSLSNIYGSSPPWLNIKPHKVSLYTPLSLCNTLLPSFSPPSFSFNSPLPLAGTSASPSPYAKWTYNFPYSLHHHC